MIKRRKLADIAEKKKTTEEKKWLQAENHELVMGLIKQYQKDLYAAINKHELKTIIDILIRYDRDIEIDDRINDSDLSLPNILTTKYGGYTPIAYASELGFHDICSLLTKYTDDPHEHDDTAVMGCTFYNMNKTDS